MSALTAPGEIPELMRQVSENRKLALDTRKCFKPWSVDITVISGTNLKPGDLGITSDPYVRLTLEGKHERTKHVRYTTNPKWNEKFLLFAMLKRSVLRVECLDHDNSSKDDELGFFEMDLSTLPLEEEYVEDFKLAGGKGTSTLRVSLCLRPNLLLRVTDDKSADDFTPSQPGLVRHLNNSKAAWSGIDVAHTDISWLGTRYAVMEHVGGQLDQVFSLDVSTAIRIAGEKCTQILQQCLTCAGQMSDRELIEILSIVCNFFYLRIGSEISAQIPSLQSSLGVDGGSGQFGFDDWVRVICQLVDGKIVSSAINKALTPYHLCCLPTPRICDLADLDEILERFGEVVEEKVRPNMDERMQGLLEECFVLTAGQKDFRAIQTFFLVDLRHYYTTEFNIIVNCFDRAEEARTKSILVVRVAEALLRSMTRHITNAATFVRNQVASAAVAPVKGTQAPPKVWFVLQLGFLIDSASIQERFRDFTLSACEPFPPEFSEAAQQILAPYFGRAKAELQKLESECVACLVSFVPRRNTKSGFLNLKRASGSKSKFVAPEYETLFQMILEASENDPQLFPSEVKQIFSQAARIRVVDELVANILRWAIRPGSKADSPQMQLEELQWALGGGPESFGHEDVVMALAEESKSGGASIITWGLLQREAFRPSHLQRRLKKVLGLCLEGQSNLQHVLNLRIIGADDLQHERLGGKTDPYVLVSVRRISFPHGTVAGPYKTKVVKNNVSPNWNENAQFILDSTDLHDLEIYCEIMDWELVLTHKCIGRVRHPLAAYDLQSGRTRGVEGATLTNDVVVEGQVQGKFHFALTVEDAPEGSLAEEQNKPSRRKSASKASEVFGAVDARQLIDGEMNPGYVHPQSHARSLWNEGAGEQPEPFLQFSLENASERNIRTELATAEGEKASSFLLAIVNHPIARLHFHQFMCVRRSEENLEFWVAAKKYYSRWTSINHNSTLGFAEMKTDALSIIDKFVRDDAEKSVCFQANTQQAILKAADADGSISPYMFEQSLRSVEEDVRREFSDFQRMDPTFAEFCVSIRRGWGKWRT